MTARARITAVRHALLQLHRALAEAERQRVERDRGRLTGGEYLELLINDPDLAWLLALSGMIVRIDELLEDSEASDPDLETCVAEIRRLLTPNPDGTEFQRRYAAHLQDTPDAVLGHGAVMRALGTVSSY
jgi:hypothetical protein